MNPKISVIVPIYNSERFLKRCIDSILNQTYKNIELILVNNGSTDNSSDICDMYSKNNNVLVEHTSKCGAGGARNIGMRLASGDYISFIDSDDLIHPEMFNKMMHIAMDTDVDLVECDLRIVTNETEHRQVTNSAQIVIESRIEAMRRIVQNRRFSVVVRIYRKKLLDNIVFRENIMAEDVYFTFQVINKIEKLALIPNKYYYYYSNSESVTKSPFNLKKLDILDSTLYLQKEILKTISDPQLIEIVNSMVLQVLLYSYKELHYHDHLDTSLTKRKEIKELIIQKYSVKDYFLERNLARFLPIKLFNLFFKAYSSFNKQRK